MKATKKLLALILAVCMLIGMPLSINVGAADADLVTIEDVYFGTPGTEDESYIYVKFSEKVWLRYTSWKNGLGVAVLNQSNGVQERLIVDNFDGAECSDENGLYKIKLVDAWTPTITASIPEWVKTEFVSNRLHAGSRIVFYVSDPINKGEENDGEIDLFNTKQDGSGKALKNGTPEITTCTGTGKEG